VPSILDLMRIAKGLDHYIDLGTGDPVFNEGILPGGIVEEAQGIIVDHRSYAYPFLLDVEDELRRYVAGIYGVKEDQVVLTSGATGGLLILAILMRDMGVGISLITPTHDLYLRMLGDLGVDFVQVPLLRPRWLMPKFRADVILLVNPSNPTGRFFTREELLGIEARVLVVDEVYMSYRYIDRGYTSSIEVVTDKPLVIVGSFSKSHLVPGLRVGYLVVNDALRRLRSEFFEKLRTLSWYVKPSTLSMRLVRRITNRVSEYPGVLRGRASIVVEELMSMGFTVSPVEGGFYVFPCMDGLDDFEFSLRLLRGHGVLVRPGSIMGVGGEGCIRVSLTQNWDRLKLGLEKLRDALRGR